MRFIGKIFCVVLLICTGTAFTLKAEPLEFIYEHYSSNNGLPHNSISDIHQDSRGYMWFCTWYGLSRYDGNGFVNYMMQPGDYSNLSHNRILSVDEDELGYLWVTTYDNNLYRFDVDLEEFVSIPGDLDGFHMNNVQVKQVEFDHEGNTWVSINGLGVLKVAPDLTYETYFSDLKYVGGKVEIYLDSEDCVYAVSETGLSSIIDGAVSLIARNIDVVDFVEVDDHVFFVCTDQVIVLDRQSREQEKVNLASLGIGDATCAVLTGAGRGIYIGFQDNAVASIDAGSLDVEVSRTSMGRVRYLFPDPEGLVWIATERTGIWAYDPDSRRFRHYEHSNNVMSYYADTLARVVNHEGRMWIKMNNYGFGYYDRCCDEIIPLSNVKEQKDARFMNGVACFEVDRTGVLWMSTVGRGLEKVSLITPKVEKIIPPTRSDDLMSSSEVRAMLKDSKGNIWIAAKSRELYRYSPDFKECRRFPDRRSGDLGVIYSIFEDADGNIWLGTKGDGLFRMKPDGDGYSWTNFRHDSSDRNSLSSNNIYSIEQDGEGRIWVGTYGGSLSMLPTSDSREFVTVNNSFPDYPQEVCDRVRYLHCMPDGRMLVATVGGLIIFEPSDNPELTVFNLIQKIPGDLGSLGNNDIIHIFTDSSENTWLSTFGGGLNRLYFEDGTPRFEVISTARGLSSNIVYSALEDAEGNIWISTQSGISRYDHKSSVVRNFTRYDGIPPTTFSEATCAALDDGTVLFGTYDNVYRMRPGDFESADSDISLAFTGLSVDGRRIPFKNEMVIPHDCSFFRIDFASLDYSYVRQTSLSYMLEGYDKKWISASGSNRATYSRIPPGKYTFKVKETWSEENRDDQIVSIRVRVRPSIWNSPVSIAVYVILAAGLLLLLARVLMTSMKLRSDVRLEQNLNEIKARFFTNVSHELRTPLTLILGGIDEISRKTASGDANEYSVNIVRKNAKRMLTLVNQLLDTRSIADGRMRLNETQFDIVSLVQEVYDDFRDMSADRQMEMRIIKSVDSLMVWGDAMRLEALVYNLLSNAFKYTSDGGKIEVGVLYREGDAEYRIMVKDNGIGVAKENQKAIFEPFTKGMVSAFRGMASSGIGLSFCKDIADIHSGEIWVESDGTSGSKFFVRLPVGKEPAGHVETYGSAKYKVEPAFPEGALKVLVAEDNPELRVYIYNNLADRYEVKDCANGMDALKTIEEGWVPDIVVTDLMMPGMDGMELISHLRNDFATSHIPILVVTAKHEDDTQVKAMKYGADGYIAKPFTMDLLIARIDNMLERRKALVSRMSSRKVDISPEEIVITDKDEQLIKKVMAWLEENVGDAEITVDQLVSHVGMGRTSMYNKIKGLTGKSPVELIQDFRLEKATYYLKSGQYSVSETSYKVGFSDPGYFSRSFKKHYGISPADYMKQNRK